MQKIYDSYAIVYDFVFGRVFQPGRILSTNIINQNAKTGAKVLEVGVGTGLSLPLYRDDLHINGIDISEKMLDKAKKRIQKENLKTDITLENMDASHLRFSDQTFDFVVAMYVASVVPDLHGFLNEITRVVKNQGHIIVVNHFISNHKALRSFEEKFARAHAVVGFKSDLSVDEILNNRQFKLIKSYNINLFGYWKLLHLVKTSS